jgi:hypothetical protein
MNSIRIVRMTLCTMLLVTMHFSYLNAQSSTGYKEQAAPQLPHVKVLLLLPGQEITGKAADGLGVYYSNAFDDTIGDEDSYKFTNPDENIGILRNGVVLAIEGRKPITQADTLPLKIWKLYQKQYNLNIEIGGFSNNVKVFIEDSYLKTTTEVTNNTETLVPFTVNASNPGSVSPTRFEKNKGIEVEWSAENESNIDHYEIEQSLEARRFNTVGTVKAGNTASSANYAWFDASVITGEKYYRVKSVDKSGEIKYTPIVKINAAKTPGFVTIATGQGNSLTMFLKNCNKGKYQLSLLNYNGQKFYAGSIYHSGGSATQSININTYLPAGIYQMSIVHEEQRENVSFLVQ